MAAACTAALAAVTRSPSPAVRLSLRQLTAIGTSAATNATPVVTGDSQHGHGDVDEGHHGGGGQRHDLVGGDPRALQVGREDVSDVGGAPLREKRPSAPEHRAIELLAQSRDVLVFERVRHSRLPSQEQRLRARSEHERQQRRLEPRRVAQAQSCGQPRVTALAPPSRPTDCSSGTSSSRTSPSTMPVVLMRKAARSVRQPMTADTFATNAMRVRIGRDVSVLFTNGFGIRIRWKAATTFAAQCAGPLP